MGDWLKRTMVHPDHGILLSHEKKQTIDTGNNLHETPRNDARLKKPVLKHCVLYDILEMIKLWEWRADEWWLEVIDEI